jgi:uncharacterized protein DUF3768
MSTPYDNEPGVTICPDCGEDLEWHTCGAKPTEQTLRVRELNDDFRKRTGFPLGPHLANGQLVITRGVAAHGNEFINRAMAAVRAFVTFGPENDPYGEHDFGSFELDGEKLFWKIDAYDTNYEYGSPNPADPTVTRRVLTVLLAEEY